MPLLGRPIEVTEVVLDKPGYPIVQNPRRQLQRPTLAGINAPAPAAGQSSLDTLQVKDFSIKTAP